MSESTMYNAGGDAYWENKSIDSNPHLPNTYSHSEWELGWKTAETHSHGPAGQDD